ncbi:MAG TPA: DNA polymerase III subunit beta [Thiotrichaceae bacterium]|jgi:DNA polymerase-3 subunit beta|nr:DNA polymerase III subunit beta [Thiotrichaceae bacterium]HIM08177.1 DNA polymerase III subunit beta [Gammaproteobacteria bacterium]
MKFNINRDDLLPVLQTVSGVVDRRQTLPILSNLLFNLETKSLSVTATDMEVELIVNFEVPLEETGELTLPARKLLDICRALPAESILQIEMKNDRVLIKSGKSRFTLATLPAAEYPVIEITENIVVFTIKQKALDKLLSNTQFAMAQQDVRYYLNGLLLEISSDKLRAVATDGHRLALDETDIKTSIDEAIQIIVPRKGITELTRLLQNNSEIEIQVSANHIRIKNADTCFTSKLIDGRFPDYKRVIPELSEKPVFADREELKNSLTRASILSNEKYRGVRIMLSANSLRALAHNPEQEEAEEELEVQYEGDELEIGFNVSYLLDTLSIIKSNKVKLSVLDANSSCLILPEDDSNCQYVVMPMRL